MKKTLKKMSFFLTLSTIAICQHFEPKLLEFDLKECPYTFENPVSSVNCKYLGKEKAIVFLSESMMLKEPKIAFGIYDYKNKAWSKPYYFTKFKYGVIRDNVNGLFYADQTLLALARSDDKYRVISFCYTEESIHENIILDDIEELLHVGYSDWFVVKKDGTIFIFDCNDKIHGFKRSYDLPKNALIDKLCIRDSRLLVGKYNDNKKLWIKKPERDDIVQIPIPKDITTLKHVNIRTMYADLSGLNLLIGVLHTNETGSRRSKLFRCYFRSNIWQADLIKDNGCQDFPFAGNLFKHGNEYYFFDPKNTNSSNGLVLLGIDASISDGYFNNVESLKLGKPYVCYKNEIYCYQSNNLSRNDLINKLNRHIFQQDLLMYFIKDESYINLDDPYHKNPPRFIIFSQEHVK